jgi:branched-subunit amino acid transport protein
MFAVTYIPRAFPAFVIEKLNFGKKFEKFINLIPYTAMTALIVPGVVTFDGSNYLVGILGGAFAIGLSCIKKIPLAVVVAASVLFVMLTYLFI